MAIFNSYVDITVTGRHQHLRNRWHGIRFHDQHLLKQVHWGCCAGEWILLVLLPELECFMAPRQNASVKLGRKKMRLGFLWPATRNIMGFQWFWKHQEELSEEITNNLYCLWSGSPLGGVRTPIVLCPKLRKKMMILFSRLKTTAWQGWWFWHDLTSQKLRCYTTIHIYHGTMGSNGIEEHLFVSTHSGSCGKISARVSFFLATEMFHVHFDCAGWRIVLGQAIRKRTLVWCLWHFDSAG